jgi:hypothetical protein
MASSQVGRSLFRRLGDAPGWTCEVMYLAPQQAPISSYTRGVEWYVTTQEEQSVI